MKELNKFDLEIQSFDIKEYLYKIIGHWKLFVIMVVLALIVAKFVNIRTQKVYNLKSLITVKDEQNPLFSSSTNIAFNWGGTSDIVETIITILQSRTHNEKVVKRLNFTLDYFVDGRFRKIDAYGNIPVSVEIDTLKHQLLNNFIQLDFISNEEVRISAELDEINILRNYTTHDSDNYVTEELIFSNVYPLGAMIETPLFSFKVNKENDLVNLSGKTYFIRFNDFNNTVKKYQDIDVSALKKGASILELSFQGHNKKKIEDFLNATIDVLDEDQRSQKIKYALKTKQYIDTLFTVEANSLKDIETNLGDFKLKNNIYDLSVEGTALLNEVTSLDREFQQIESRMEYLNNLENYLISNSIIDSDHIPAPALINMEDPGIVTSVNNLIVLAKTREGLEKKVKSNYPPLIRVNEQMELESSILLEQIKSLKKNIENNLKTITRRINSTNNRLSRLNPKEQKLLNFQRKYNITEANYNYLKQKSYEAGTAIAANVSDVKILDRAKDVGQSAIKPKASFNYLVALMAGLMLPFLFVLTKETLNNKFQTVEEIQKSYKIPVLGVIGKNRYDKDRLVVHRKPNSTVAESFRALRSNIQFLFQHKGLNKTIVITSSVSGEGKTLCAENMATVFAMSGKKTILLGLDLRKPKMHTDFGADNSKGVVNYLIGERSLDEITLKSGIDNLDLITSGPVPPNPSELLINDQAEALFEVLKKKYDYIIVDTPPVGLVADALELFKYADAIIYMIRQNYTQRGMPKMIDDKYKNGEVKNISYVLNDFEVQNKYGGGYGYGYGYGYGKYGNGYHKEEKLSWLKKIGKRFRSV
jgi:capsular exopolysaccharide synthesis family protein